MAGIVYALGCLAAVSCAAMAAENEGEKKPSESAFERTAAPHVEVPVPAESKGGKADVPDYFKAHQSAWDEDAVAPAPGAPVVKPAASAGEGLRGTAMRAAMYLCVLCGLIILSGFLLKKYGKNTPLLAGMQLGTVLGKVHLGPRTALHYVKTGGRVLVIGVTQTSIALLTDFDAETFETAAPPEKTRKGKPFADLLEQLRPEAEQAAPAEPMDDELASLRGDVQRLRQYLRDSAREPGE
jgi:flagellar biogenesis protein FliO